jgi:hypothetical protein
VKVIKCPLFIEIALLYELNWHCFCLGSQSGNERITVDLSMAPARKSKAEQQERRKKTTMVRKRSRGLFKKRNGLPTLAPKICIGIVIHNTENNKVFAYLPTRDWLKFDHLV